MFLLILDNLVRTGIGMDRKVQILSRVSVLGEGEAFVNQNGFLGVILYSISIGVSLDESHSKHSLKDSNNLIGKIYVFWEGD